MQSLIQAVWSQPEVQAVVETLEPFEVYLVGGAVRDLVLGRPVKDFDFLVDCEPQALLARKSALRKATGFTVIVLDGQRGILRVCCRDSEGLDLAARQGDSVLRDLARRDVTFNAMAIASNGSLLDPFLGRDDIARGLVRVTAAGVLQDDPLRVLRCLRLAAQLDFALEAGTREYLRQYAPGLERVAGERIWEELQRFLEHAHWHLIADFRDADVASAIWAGQVPGWDGALIPWAWLEQWWSTRPAMLGAPDLVLAPLAAMLLPFRAQAEPLAWRLRMSKAHSRYLKAWWAGHRALRSAFPTTSREVLEVVKQAGESLPGLLSFAVLSGFGSLPLSGGLAERLLRAASGEGELRLAPLPLGGEELCAHFGRPPGAWLGGLLAELQAAWACREAQNVSRLLAHAEAYLHLADG